MPLLDHFRPPLSERRDWHSFHSHWAVAIASALNDRLPADYLAEAHVQYGVEIDVAVTDEDEPGSAGPGGWSPPAATLTVPFAVETDAAEVRIYRVSGGRVLAAAVELVSPANKDRPDAQDAFVAKCEAYLRRGAGLAVVDIDTTRTANLHNRLMRRLGAGLPDWGARLYAVAYRPEPADGSGRLAVWPTELAVGADLPAVPLGLLGGPCVGVPLDEAYRRACREVRIPQPPPVVDGPAAAG